MNKFVLTALAATLGTWLLTALGAATVVFFKRPGKRLMDLMLGFASGVMIAASFWSLLLPAVEGAEQMSVIPPYIVAVSGFLCGALFMWGSDKVVSSALRHSEHADSPKRSSRIMMLILSITLHNIPEGLAVGVAFGALAQRPSAEGLMGALTVAIGIGIQNFPEGAAVSLPLRREGFSRKMSFFLGQSSGMVEPIAGVVGASLAVYAQAVLPFALSFAAGTMILVAVHELIPECQSERDGLPYGATMGIILGFAVMTLLDVMLG